MISNKNSPPYGISIHALRGEGDGLKDKNGTKIFKFQSTPSVGRATAQHTIYINSDNISIHALRGEGDRRHR